MYTATKCTVRNIYNNGKSINVKVPTIDITLEFQDQNGKEAFKRNMPWSSNIKEIELWLKRFIFDQDWLNKIMQEVNINLNN